MCSRSCYLRQLWRERSIISPFPLTHMWESRLWFYVGTRFCCIVQRKSGEQFVWPCNIQTKTTKTQNCPYDSRSKVSVKFRSSVFGIVCHSVEPAGTFLHRRIHSEKKKYASWRTRIFRRLHVGASFSPVWFWINILYPLNGWIAPVWWQEAKLEKHFRALPPRPSAVIYYLQLGPWWMTVCM